LFSTALVFDDNLMTNGICQINKSLVNLMEHVQLKIVSGWATAIGLLRERSRRVRADRGLSLAMTWPILRWSKMLIDIAGYLAASLVLATFCTRSMGRLRSIALASNVAFITYGYLANLTPVLVLHAILLPVNAYRLGQLYWSELSTKVPARQA
jgi:hypothetical protein